MPEHRRLLDAEYVLRNGLLNRAKHRRNRLPRRTSGCGRRRHGEQPAAVGWREADGTAAVRRGANTPASTYSPDSQTDNNRSIIDHCGRPRRRVIDWGKPYTSPTDIHFSLPFPLFDRLSAWTALPTTGQYQLALRTKNKHIHIHTYRICSNRSRGLT